MSTIYEISIDGGRYVDALIDATLPHASVQHVVDGSDRPIHARSVSIDPATFVSGPSRGLLDWTVAALRRQYVRRNLVVRAVNLHGGSSYTLEMMDCLLLEALLPALDKSSKAAAILKTRILPERIKVTKLAGANPVARSSKQWHTSNFRFKIGGIDTDAVATVSAMTVKQGVKTHYTGQDRFPNIEPTKSEASDLTITLPYDKGDAFMTWHKEMFTSATAAGGRKASLEYLSPSNTAYFTLDFADLVLVSAQQKGRDLKVELSFGSVAAQAR